MRIEDLPPAAREQIAAKVLQKLITKENIEMTKERRIKTVSKPRYDDWSYVKGMVRRYPELKREYNDLHEQFITARYNSEVTGGNGDGRVLENIAIRELPTSIVDF